MAYPDEQRKSRVVVETPTSRREVVQTERAYDPERRGVSTGVVVAVAIAAIAITALVVWALTRRDDTTDMNSNVRVVTQPTPVTQQQPVIIQQPAPATQPPPVIVQQPASTQPIIVPPATSSSSSSSTTDTQPKPSGTDDATIQTNIDKKIQEDTTLASLGISAMVLDGKVTLTGSVNTPDLKRRVERLVKGIKGVRSVDNQLLVSDTTP